MLRDLHSALKAITHVIAQAITVTNTPGTGVDRKGFGAVEFLISIGVVANIANSPQPTWSLKMQESDLPTSGFTDVVNPDSVLVGSGKSPITTPNTTTGIFLTIDGAADDAATYRIGYIGNKRYTRIVNTAANTPGSTPYSVVALLGRPGIAPTQDV